MKQSFRKIISIILTLTMLVGATMVFTLTTGAANTLTVAGVVTTAANCDFDDDFMVTVADVSKLLDVLAEF